MWSLLFKSKKNALPLCCVLHRGRYLWSCTILLLEPGLDRLHTLVQDWVRGETLYLSEGLPHCGKSFYGVKKYASKLDLLGYLSIFTMMGANNNEKALDEIPAEKYTSEGRTATVVMECSQEADVGIHDQTKDLWEVARMSKVCSSSSKAVTQRWLRCSGEEASRSAGCTQHIVT